MGACRDEPRKCRRRVFRLRARFGRLCRSCRGSLGAASDAGERSRSRRGYGGIEANAGQVPSARHLVHAGAARTLRRSTRTRLEGARLVMRHSYVEASTTMTKHMACSISSHRDARATSSSSGALAGVIGQGAYQTKYPFSSGGPSISVTMVHSPESDCHIDSCGGGGGHMVRAPK